MAAPILVTPTAKLNQLPSINSKSSTTVSAATSNPKATTSATNPSHRRQFLSLAATILTPSWLLPLTAIASDDDDYVKETKDVLSKVRTTISMEKTDPNVAVAVADLRETSNSWVAKYRREKALLGRVSFRDMYSALNAVSGHYISFGPTAPIPAKRKARILEEMETVEKALSRGR